MGNIVLVGAGGTGMSGVAGLLYDLGYKNLVCIDGFQSELTDKLNQKGLKMIIGHGKYEPNLDDAVIYSETTVDSPEVTKARSLAKEQKKMMLIISYFQLLGEISKYFITVGFAGTNGKSSTTALGIYGAKQTLPNFGLGILGTMVPDFNNQSYYINPDHTNAIRSIFDFILTGKSSTLVPHPATLTKKFYFFVEACEYRRQFLNLDLDYSIITSLELDHTDYYKDMDDYLDAFSTLIEKTKQKVFVPENLNAHNSGNKGSGPLAWADAHLPSSKIIKVTIEKINFKHIRGSYNDTNGSLVQALLSYLSSNIYNLSSFKGLRRRMELLGENSKGAKIYTDYGHIASSIVGGYKALKEKYPNKKLFIIFQPHQINRVLLGWDDFIKAVKPYDKAIIYDIYAARENIQELVRKFQSAHPELHESMNLMDLGNMFAQECGGEYITNIKNIIEEIKACSGETVIVIFSAGDIDYQIRGLDFKV